MKIISRMRTEPRGRRSRIYYSYEPNHYCHWKLYHRMPIFIDF